MKKLLLAALLLLSAVPALAEEKPILSWSRLALAAGLDYAWYNAPVATSAQEPQFKKEWEPGLYAAYTLAAPKPETSGPIVTLAASSAYGLDNKLARFKVGIRVGLKPAK